MYIKGDVTKLNLGKDLQLHLSKTSVGHLESHSAFDTLKTFQDQ